MGTIVLFSRLLPKSRSHVHLSDESNFATDEMN